MSKLIVCCPYCGSVQTQRIVPGKAVFTCYADRKGCGRDFVLDIKVKEYELTMYTLEDSEANYGNQTK